MAHGGFTRNETNGVTTYAVSFLEQTGLVRAAFSTRLGGVSQGETATMNFSTKRADTVENVRENYRRLCAATGIDPTHLVVTRQVHGTVAHEPTPDEVGMGVFDDQVSPEADALMTDRHSVALVKHSADCVPVWVVDTATPAIALIHAGWRGTYEEIVDKTLSRMAERYGTRPADCLAAIGPSIGACCFEVGDDVAELFATRFPGDDLVTQMGGRPHVDLWRCNERQLLRAGVPAASIAVAGLCTACDTATFYSHRREQGHTGVMAAVLELRG